MKEEQSSFLDLHVVHQIQGVSQFAFLCLLIWCWQPLGNFTYAIPLVLHVIYEISRIHFEGVVHTKAFKLPSPGYDNVDHFSGKGAIAKGFKGRGRNIARLDLELNEKDEPRLC